MRHSSMLEMMISVLLLGGVGKRTLHYAGVSTRAGLFFMLSLALLHRFELHPAEAAAVSPACLICACWMLGFASGPSRGKRLWLLLPASATAGALLAYIPLEGNSMILVGALTCLPAAFLGDLRISLAFCALMPLFASGFSAVNAALTTGYFELEAAETTLTVQLAGMLASTAALTVKNSIRTTVRELSDDRAA